MAIEIVRPTEADRAAWRRLFDGYAAFYKVPMDDAIAGRTWAWIQDQAHLVEGVVAKRGGAVVGLAHFRAMPSPLRGVEIGFLDDLFVDPTARGGRDGEALIAQGAAEATRRGWPRIRRTTADDNLRARALDARVAKKANRNVDEITL